ncbi:MAG: class I SAM-dependent methyltransferase [Actinomycetota bacterium]
MSFKNPSKLEIIAEELLTYRLGFFIYKPFLKFINPQGIEKVIDFRCGGGSFAKQVIKKIGAGSLTCIDSSNFWVNKAKKRFKRYKNISFTSSINDSKLASGSFDLACIHFVLHDIDKDKRKNIINNISSKLKKDGKIFIKGP